VKYAHEHPAPAGVVDVEVVLDDPALRHLQMPAVIFPVSVGDQNPARLACSQDCDDRIGFGLSEVLIHEIIAPAGRRFANRDTPLLRTVGYPVPELIRDAAQQVTGHSLPLAIVVEETDHSFGLLERLDQTVQRHPVKATIVESDTILVMLEEGIHGNLQCGQIPDRKSTKLPTLKDGQLLRTNNGRAEILLGPGVFVRLGPHAALRMVNSRLEDTQIEIEQGAALVEVVEIANGDKPPCDPRPHAHHLPRYRPAPP
jgi:hypothetical protein